jgi:exonuclease SbcC
MRPRELTVRGFRSFADETTFGFSGRGLVGIVGPIGSGKSSILDAITFALYGKTPKIERDTKSLISQRRDSLHVALSFEVDGAPWRVVRSLRRGGAAAHTLYRIDGDGEHEVTDKAREVTERITELLGMEFEAFRRSVLLAQNQFAGFLEATGTERNQVLKGVFGFDRLDAMRDVAKGRLDVIGASLQHLAARRASAEADRQRLAALATALAAADVRARTLDALRESVMQAEAVLRAAETAVAAAVAEQASLDAVGERIPSHADTAASFQAAHDAEAGLADAEAALTTAGDAAVAADDALQAMLDRVGGAAALQEVGDAVTRLAGLRQNQTAAIARRDRTGTDAAAGGEAAAFAATSLATAEQAAAAAERALVAAVEDAAAARDALHAAHDAQRAAVLRSGLRAGAECPVCTQMVAVVPPPVAGADLDSVAAAAQRAEAAAESARRAAATATAAVAEARARSGAAEERAAELAARVAVAEAEVATAATAVAGMEADLAVRLGPGDPVQLLAARRDEVAAAEAAVRQARATETAARRQRDQVASERDRTRIGLERLRTEVAALAGRLGFDLAVTEGAAALDDALRALRTEWVQRRSAATAAAEQAGREAAAATAARTDLLEKAGLAASADIVEVTTEALKERTALETEVRVLERNLAELAGLGEEEAETLAQRALLERLHGDLAPSKFLEFVLDERRRVLADLAGVHFETLTAGRYRFSDDGEFDIVDLAAADLVRAAASLSGGETFLASLALALALAEIVAREGGRLDSFFLDEGFGSLDAEHLDLAMDGIERLVAAGGDRLVVVVSHVPALRERFEDLVVLDRDAVTGVTRVLAGAGGSG